MKRQLTKQLQLELDVRHIQPNMISFLEENLRKFPGKSSLRVILTEPKSSLKANLVSFDKGLEMNDDLLQFLEKSPEIEVKVTTV